MENCRVISGGWGRVSLVYSPEVGLKGRALVRFCVIKKGVNLKMMNRERLNFERLQIVLYRNLVELKSNLLCLCCERVSNVVRV